MKPKMPRWRLPRLEADDSLVTHEVGGWADDKYRLVRNYGDTFTTSMDKK